MKRGLQIILVLLFLTTITFADNHTEMKYCNDEGYFCLQKNLCDTENDVTENHYCASKYVSCCTKMPTCKRANGTICSEKIYCEGYIQLKVVYFDLPFEKTRLKNF